MLIDQDPDDGPEPTSTPTKSVTAPTDTTSLEPFDIDESALFIDPLPNRDQHSGSDVSCNSMLFEPDTVVDAMSEADFKDELSFPAMFDETSATLPVEHEHCSISRDVKGTVDTALPVSKPRTPERQQYDNEHTDARELHAKLESMVEFSKWFRVRTEECELVEGVDFGACLTNSSSKEHEVPNAANYWLTPFAAMEMAILEPTEQGKKYRKYIIETEKQAREQALAEHNRRRSPPTSATRWR